MISKSLGPQLFSSLPAFHAFTGLDYTTTFVRKGKVQPFNKLENNPDVQQAFKTLSTDGWPSEKCKETLFKFTAIMYGAAEKSKVTLNAYWFKTFERI